MTRRIVDLTGQKFDLLKAVSYAGIAKNGGTNWLCECECGKTKIMSGSYLKRKDRYKSCGCKSKNASDWIIGKTFGLWAVEEKVKTKNGWKFLCTCTCGKKSLQCAYDLTSGKTKSCGCFVSRSPRSSILKDHPLYGSWRSMRDRCNNPANPKWYRYGGRGIKICSRWENFMFFAADMGPRPKGASLDRINNDGDYEPSNCRWATPKQQSQNTRRNIWIEKDARIMCASDWAKELNTSHTTVKRWAALGKFGKIVNAPNANVDG